MRERIRNELESALAEIPVFDVHTHLVGGKLGARGLHDILLYHMSVSDLYAAGCPSGSRLTEYPGWPDEAEATGRIEEALPYLPLVRNTSISWGIRIILRDLYNWTEPVTLDNWRTLDAKVRERADDRTWQRSVLDGLNIRRTGTEIMRRESGIDDDRLQYALEWAFFTRAQWGEYDTAVYELERCWGRPPESPTPIGTGKRPPMDRTIQTLEDVHAAVDHYLENIPYDMVTATAGHVSTDIEFRTVTGDEMSAALQRRDQAGPEERDIYASYINEQFLSGLEQRPEEIVYQFSYAAEPLPYETGSRVTQKSIGQLAEMIGRHPGLHFQCNVASQHANQSLCTMCRELPNFSLTAYWWHNFFPSIIEQIMAERLDMLPVNKQVGFFSDAYCLEWVYAKMIVVRKCLANVLAARIETGQYTQADALEIAHEILYNSPRALLRFEPYA